MNSLDVSNFEIKETDGVFTFKNENLSPLIRYTTGLKYVTICQNSGSISKEYRLPPKKTMGVITRVGMIDICSKLELINPIKKPNNAKVNETKIKRKIINIGN